MRNDRYLRSTQRNITPNFLRFKSPYILYLEKSIPKSIINDQPIDNYVDPYTSRTGYRSGSKASRSSFDVYEKRVLQLSKLKSKNKYSSVEGVSKRKKEGIEVTTRRSNSKDGIGLQEGRIAVLDVLRAKMQMSESNKNLPSAREGKQSRNDSNGNNSHRQQSNSKRTDDSLDREYLRAKKQNIDFLNNLLHNQTPNYLTKLKAKKIEQKEYRESVLEREIKEGRKDIKEQGKYPVREVVRLYRDQRYKEGKYPRETRESRYARYSKYKRVNEYISKKKRRKFLDCEIDIKLEYSLKNYQLFEELGKGAYGIVRMGISLKTNYKVAIKIYSKNKLDYANKIKNLYRYVNILSRLSHPVIARLIEAIETPTEIYLVLEYGGANSLYNYLLSKSENRLSETYAKLFLRTITDTLRYLHERNIVHRDIKAENILLNRNKHLKLIDFGFSLYSLPNCTIDTFCGTPTYMAPEIVSKKDHVPVYTDMWSLGILFYVMLQGNYPFRAKTEAELFEKIRKGHFEYIHKNISYKCRYTIYNLLKVDPLERLTVKQLDQSYFDWLMKSEQLGAGESTNFTNCSN